MSVLTSTRYGNGIAICDPLHWKHKSSHSHYYRQIQPIHPIYLSLLLTSPKRHKESFPLFVKMSDQRYRSDRTKLLYKLIGQNFKTLRGYKGLSIQQLADATAISAYRLRKLEAGTLRIPPSLLVDRKSTRLNSSHQIISY